TGELLREHRRQAPGRRAIHPADRPTRTPPTTLALLARAVRAGAQVGTLCETIHRRDGEAGVRRILGVLTLVKKHGAPAVEDACAAALELAVADYRFVPLLLIDDLGMRRLPHTAAEDLLEIVMRRYEKASTLITSNRPVDDWGKLLGDTAAVTAMLDRLLHHAHVLTCGPRSWRTRLHSDRNAS